MIKINKKDSRKFNRLKLTCVNNWKLAIDWEQYYANNLVDFVGLVSKK